MRALRQLVFFISAFSVLVLGQADLAVSAVVSNPIPKNDDIITYTVTLTNNGPTLTTNVTVSCFLPRGLTYQSSLASNGTYNNLTGAWDLALVNPGTETLTITAKVEYFKSAYDVRDFKDYNALIRHDGSFTGSNAHGKVGAGHDLNITGSVFGDMLRIVNPVPDVVIAQNNLNFNSGVAYHGNVVYGNTTTLPLGAVTYPQGILRHATPFNFASFSAYAIQLTADLAVYPVTGTTVMNSGTVTLTGTDIYLNVFNVSASDFNAASTISVNVPHGSVALINVAGVSLQFTGTVNLNGSLINHVLFNFPAAVSLAVTGSKFEGTILAPFADVNTTGTLTRGQIFGNNLTSISTHDLYNFVGFIPLNRHIVFHPYIALSDSLDNVPANNSTNRPIDVQTTNPFGSLGNGSWSLSDSLPGNEMVSCFARLDVNTVLAGTWGGKIYRVSNTGVLDTVINASMLPAAVIWDMKVNGSAIYAATTNGLMRSANGGLTWTLVGPSADVRAILFATDGYAYIGTWGAGVYRSADGGATWQAMNQNIGSTVIQTLLERVENTNHTLFAGGFLSGLSASYNSAASWNDIGFPSDFVLCLAKSSQGILFAGTQVDGVYRSYDNGNTWNKLSGVPEGPIYAIRVDGNNNLFVSSWQNGIYASGDLGNSFSYLGLGGYAISTIFPSADGRIFVGTKNGKIAVSNKPFAVKDPVSLSVNNFALMQNYPNPFNPSTKIQFSVPKAGTYSVKVYNLLGQLVATLADETLAAGQHAVLFDAATLTSGMYVYTLSGNGMSISKKMILMK
ncbi:MAG: choice-of-anchor A family protein [Ignavibacteria bacterium]|nr:choice-of-anchor A family protein [Ignavibacteria bacterium]